MRIAKECQGWYNPLLSPTKPSVVVNKILRLGEGQPSLMPSGMSAGYQGPQALGPECKGWQPLRRDKKGGTSL